MLADAAPSSPEAGMLIRDRSAQLRRRRAADAVRRLPRRGAHAAPRRGGAGGALWRVVRAGVPSPVHAAAAGCARRAVLLRARRSGRQRVEALLRRGLSVRALWRFVSALGGAHGVLPAWRGAGAGGGIAGRHGLSLLCPHRDATGADAGATRGRRTSSRWAAASRTPTPWHMPTGWTWSRRRSASACRAACAIAPIAAAAPFRRWSTGWRSIRKTAGVAPYRFETRRG